MTYDVTIEALNFPTLETAQGFASSLYENLEEAMDRLGVGLHINISKTPAPEEEE